MCPPRPLAALALCLPLLAAAGPAAVPAPERAMVVAGVVTAVDLNGHRLTLETAQAGVEITWDRNTLIYQPGGATTAAALKPGVAVRAGVDSTRTAFWIQLRPPPEPAPPPAPAPGGRNSTPGARP